MVYTEFWFHISLHSTLNSFLSVLRSVFFRNFTPQHIPSPRRSFLFVFTQAYLQRLHHLSSNTLSRTPNKWYPTLIWYQELLFILFMHHLVGSAGGPGQTQPTGAWSTLWVPYLSLIPGVSYGWSFSSSYVGSLCSSVMSASTQDYDHNA